MECGGRKQRTGGRKRIFDYAHQGLSRGFNRSRRHNIPIFSLLHMFFHSGVFRNNDRYTSGECFHWGIPETVFIRGMHEHIGTLQQRQRIPGAYRDALIRHVALHQFSHRAG